MSVPAGHFENCFKLRQQTAAYAGGVTTTTQLVTWAAPSVGDIRWENVDVNGTETVAYELVSYYIP